MIDIHFYEKIYDLKKTIMSNNVSDLDLNFVFDEFERCRSKEQIGRAHV